MTIQVRCPNGDCGKLLSVRDDFGGKTGKCPNCGSTMKIPLAGNDDENIQAAPAESGPRDRAAPVYPAGTRRREEEDEEAYEDARPRRRRPADDEEDEYEEARPRRRRRADDEDEPLRPRRQTPTSPITMIVCLAVATGLLTMLALVPLFSMMIISPAANRPLPENFTVAGMINLTEGKLFMIGSLVLVALCLANLIVFLTASARVSRMVITIGGCIIGGGSLTLMLWDLGFIWDIFNVNRWIQENTAQGLEPGFYPGIGLWIGLVASIGVIVLMGIILGMWGKGLWLYGAEGLGLLAGTLLLVLNVQPWYTAPSIEEIKNAKGLQELRDLQSKSKMNNRYDPLIDFKGKRR